MGVHIKKTIAIRVCVVSPLYHPSLGGLGRQAQVLSEKLAESGIPLFVIARRMINMPSAVFSTRVRVYRAWSIRPKTHTFEDVTFLNILTSLTFSISASVLLYRKRHEYDVVHFHGASLPLIVALFLLKILRKKIIAKVASSNLGIEPGSLKGRYFGIGSILLRLFRKIDFLVATTSQIEEKLLCEGISADQIVRIPNFIDFSKFSPYPGESKNYAKAKVGLSNGPLVTFSGRFIQCKGISYLLHAWSKVNRICPDARLLMLGNGPLFDSVMNLSSSLKISTSVIMKGHVDNIIEYLHASDIFVFPSLQEGMPNSLLEAMACGLPPVATRIGGVVDIIENNKNGILVEPEDVQGLADGIILLLNDRTLSNDIANQAFQTIAASFSLEKTIQKYLALYDRFKMNV